jgi:myo-inositol-1(or 4)-monophosphatase
VQIYLDVAVAAARGAGQLICARLGACTTLETKSSASDLVTDVDRASEELVSKTILAAFPNHLFLGEEGMTAGPSRHEIGADFTTEDPLWICDPIDGTTNFVHGVPFCTVALCLVIRGELVVGVVYDPSRDEMFTAVRGQGAKLNGQPVQVRPESTLGQSLVGTGFSSHPEVQRRNVQGVAAIVPYVRNVRAMGSAQLHLAYVAAGRLTGFWEYGLAPWDIAAGALLIQEAGGTVTDLSGDPYRLTTTNVLGTNGLIHAVMLDRVSVD